MESLSEYIKSKGFGTVISCAKNPYDLRPVANGLAEAIMRKRASLAKDQRFVVLLSEQHNVSAIPIMHMMTINRLLNEAGEKRRVAVGLEMSHDFLRWIFKKFMRTDFTTEQRREILAADPYGQLTIDAALVEGLIEAPVAHRTMLSTLRRRGLSISFNDLSTVLDTSSKPYRVILDRRDPYTDMIVTAYAPDMAGHPIPIGGTEGSRVRNIAIVDRTGWHIRDTKAEIYIQTCGHAHSFGTTMLDNYKDSLHAVFTQVGAAVLPVVFGNNKDPYDIIPTDAQDMLADAVAVCDYADNAYLDNQPGEKAFIAKLAAKSQTNFKIFDLPKEDKLIQRTIEQIVPVMARLRGMEPPEP